MIKINLTFWKEPYKINEPFNLELKNFITSAEVSKSQKNTTETFFVILKDIGLQSQFGDFEIVREDGIWKTNDIESRELNFLKWSIISALELQNI